MADMTIPQTLIEQIAKHWGWEVGDKVRAEINAVIGAHNIDIDQLQSAIQTIQGLLDADPNTPEFDVGQNIVTQLADHLTRITGLENDMNILKGDESVVGSVAYAVKQERDRAQAAEASLQEAINNEASTREQADAALQAQIDEITGGSSGSISALQNEVDAIEAGVGLGDDGTYTANTSTNYIDEATSVVDATEKLDAALKGVDDRTSTLETQMSQVPGQIDAAKQEAIAHADQVAQQKADEAKAQAIEQAKTDVMNAFANISAATLASIFRRALDCGFDGKPKADVLNGTGDCAAAGGGGNSGDGNGGGDGGDGAVI